MDFVLFSLNKTARSNRVIFCLTNASVSFLVNNILIPCVANVLKISH